MKRSPQQPTRPRKGTVLSICAPEGGGKTDFTLSMPAPHTIISVDPNTEAIVNKAVVEGRLVKGAVTIEHINTPAIAFTDQDDVQTEADEAWTQMIDTLRPFIDRDNDDRPMTVTFDTATDIDRLNVLAEFGKTDKIAPESRRNRMGPVNARYLGMIRALQNAGVHVALLHRVHEQWEDAAPDPDVRSARGGGGSGGQRQRVEGPWAYDRKGFKETGNICSVEIFLAHDPSRHEKLAAQFGMHVRRCTLRPALKGQEWWGREKLADGTRIRRASWAYLMAQVVAGSTIEEWL